MENEKNNLADADCPEASDDITDVFSDTPENSDLVITDEEEPEAEEGIDEAEEIRELHENFSMSKSFDTLSAMPCFGRYSELREKGLSVKEAYAAANCDAVIRAAHSAEIGLSGTKSHLRSNVPKRASSVTVTMSRTELAEWRSLFPGKSDKDIAELYRRVTKR